MNPAASRLAAALASLDHHSPAKIELSLGRIERLLGRLGNPHHRLPPTIHVAGTNGKGSTCAFMRAMAEAAGLKVHVYTSPHLVRFNECVRLAGNLIEDDHFADVLERTKAAMDGDVITHFEAITAAAFLAFSEVPADLLILEVGMGGRGDATNVIPNAAVSVISPIDYDHKPFLGETLCDIAGHKAGIIRAGVPVVSAVQRLEVSKVIAGEAEKLGAPLHVLCEGDQAGLPDRLSLLGGQQRSNAALAAKALKLWADPRIRGQDIKEGAQSAVWPARMQKLQSGPVTAMAGEAEVWLDGGHNPHAAAAIAEFIAGLPGETVLVSAMLTKKDAEGFFRAFKGIITAVHICPNSPRVRGRSARSLARAAKSVGLNASAHRRFQTAFEAAAARAPARILICGSLYLAGDVLLLNDEIPT